MANILITAKISPDIDGVACVLAYTNLLSSINSDKSAKYFSGIFGEPHPEARFILNKLNLNPTEPIVDFENIILVDASDTLGMPTFLPSQVIEVVDHRFITSNEEVQQKFPNAKIQNEAVGAAATLIGEKFIEFTRVPSIEMSTLLICAIYSNTLNLESNLVTERDIAILNFLRSNYPINLDIVSEMFEYKTEYAMDNLKDILFKDAKSATVRYFKFGVMQLEVFGDAVLNLKSEMLNHLRNYLTLNNLDFGFINIPDMQNKKTYFVTEDQNLQIPLEQTFQVKFQNNVAIFDNLILRKQVLQKLNE